MASSRVFLLAIALLSVAKQCWSSGDVPTGHLQALGLHRPADKQIDSYDEVLTPQIFWEKYASQRKPVVFRGAASRWEASQLWSDDYLTERFGQLEVKLEGKREKFGKHPVGAKGVGRDTIENFLKSYKNEDKYIVSQLPEPMYEQVSVLPCLLCGTFKKRLLEVNLWVSAGGSRSLLHRDADNAINCLVEGRKDWIMVDPAYDDYVSMADEGDGALGGFSLVNVDKVNLLKHPQFKKIHWTYTNLTAGDCIFIPYGHFHQVRSYERNIAVSVLFARLEEFSPKPDCPANGSLPQWDVLSNQHVAWSYPGHGEMSMGNSDPEHVRDSFIVVLDEDNLPFIDKDRFMQQMCTAKELPKRPPGQSYGPDFEECWSLVDPDGDGKVTMDDVKSLSHATLQKLTVFVDQDPANMPDYEYYSLSYEDVRSFVESTLRERSKVSLRAFLKAYVAVLHGSKVFGEKLFAKLDTGNQGFLTADNIPPSDTNVYDEYYRDYGKVDQANEQFSKMARDDFDPEEFADEDQQTGDSFEMDDNEDLEGDVEEGEEYEDDAAGPSGVKTEL